MHHVGEALDRVERFHLHGTEAGDPPQVVPAQVHEHVMLGQLLFIRKEFRFQPPVLLRGGAAGPGAGQGKGVQDAALQLHQGFGTRTGDLHVRAGEVEHVRGRIDRPQHAVNVQEASLEGGAEPVAQHDLEDIALPDVVFGLLHHAAEGFPAEQGRDLAHQAAGRIRCLGAFREELPQRLQFHLRPVVSGFALGQPRVDDQDDLLAEVVEGDDLVEQHQVHVLETLRILGDPLRGGLGVADIVIGEIADQAAGERRKPRKARAAVFGKDPAQHRRGIAGFQADIPGLHDAVEAGDAHLRVVAEERVPSPGLQLFRRFQQETVGGDVFQFPHGLDRRADVREQFAADRRDLVPAVLPQLQDFLQGGKDLHRRLRFSCRGKKNP